MRYCQMCLVTLEGEYGNRKYCRQCADQRRLDERRADKARQRNRAAVKLIRYFSANDDLWPRGYGFTRQQWRETARANADLVGLPLNDRRGTAYVLTATGPQAVR